MDTPKTDRGTGDTLDDRGLPELLRPLFWDCDFDSLSWRNHKDFITGRILVSGGWESVRWLQRSIGNEGVRHWILRRRGRNLSPQQLRFWELVLGLKSEQVDRWLAERELDPWHRRTHRSAATESP